MKQLNESMEPLLSSDDEPATSISLHDNGRIRSKITTAALTLIVLLLSYISIILTLNLSAKSVCMKPDMPYTPANSIITYERKKIWGGKSEFMGPPSPQVDAAWTELLTGLNLRATEEELILAGENLTSAGRLVDGDYVVVPLVFHHLHCLNSFRKMNYIDYYRAKVGPDVDTSIEEGHFDHCLEELRKQLMCHADLSLLTGEWVAPKAEHEHIKLRTNSQSMCINWEAYWSWTRPRYLANGKYAIRPGPFEGHEQESRSSPTVERL